MRKLILLGCLATTAASAQTYSTPYAVTTYAGSVGYAASGDGQGTSAYFNWPEGLAVDTSGNLYVADTKNDAIRVVETTGSNAGLVNTLAGSGGSPGSTNGSGSAARFNQPAGLAVDGSGNLFVADSQNNLIRKISGGTVTTFAGSGALGHANGAGTGAAFGNPVGIAVDASGNVFVSEEGSDVISKITTAGVVTVFAGTVGTIGHADGTGTGATFNHPEGLAIDSSGNLYVADTGNNSIRKITPSGVVTTLAGSGSPTVYGDTDGTGSAALFQAPVGVAVDSALNVYVADSFNNTIRRITAGGVVTTLAGDPTQSEGSTDGTGKKALFQVPFGIAVDSSGVVYVADTQNQTIRRAVSAALLISIQPVSQVAIAGGSATFSVTATSPTTMSYQWQFNGTNISGATASSYTVGNVQPANVGTYDVVITNSGGSSATSSGATLTIANITPPTVTNPASQVVNAGTTVTFSASATGGAISYQWYFDGQSIAGATSSTLTLPNVAASQAGYYSVGAVNQAGSAISANASLTVNYSARLTNLSARASVGTSANILIAGFGVSGTGSKQVLLRGVGPGLATTFGLTGVLAQPQLTLYDSVVPTNPQVIATCTAWGTAPVAGPSTVQAGILPANATVMTTVGAFSLVSGSADAAMIVTLPPGNYTAQLSGVSGTTGIALVEIYEVP